MDGTEHREVPSTEHYEQLLAHIYDWMQGGWDAKADQNRALFDTLGVRPSTEGDLAVDLGAGTGYQAVPLAELGYSVLAIDASAAMVEQLTARTSVVAPEQVTAIVDDLCRVDSHLDRPVQLFVCMGDTLFHLATHEDLIELLRTMYAAQPSGGRVVLSFRDGTTPASGDGRFLPVRSDADRVFTCFVEEVDADHLRIHDLVHVRSDTGFSQNLSSYTKIRIRTDWLVDQIVAAGYEPPKVSVEAGMTVITTQR